MSDEESDCDIGVFRNYPSFHTTPPEGGDGGGVLLSLAEERHRSDGNVANRLHLRPLGLALSRLPFLHW